MEVALGIIIGLILAVFSLLALIYFKPQIERTLAQTASSFKEKGAILEVEDNEVNAWVDSLKEV